MRRCELFWILASSHVLLLRPSLISSAYYGHTSGMDVSDRRRLSVRICDFMIGEPQQEQEQTRTRTNAKAYNI